MQNTKKDGGEQPYTMLWISPSEKDADQAAFEKRLWNAADQYRTKIIDHLALLKGLGGDSRQNRLGAVLFRDGRHSYHSLRKCIQRTSGDVGSESYGVRRQAKRDSALEWRETWDFATNNPTAVRQPKCRHRCSAGASPKQRQALSQQWIPVDGPGASRMDARADWLSRQAC
ncbi:MAG TPA: hypothetical protein DCE44_25945 [Verrucomicrobiales bacterium]|nr:hypothetical protein [Verrucomicrobiales bacterium]